MNEMEDLYQEIILDHNRRPRNYHSMSDASARAKGDNPMCGDEIEIFVKLEGDRIVDLSFQGQGCAISRASASLMTEKLKGRTITEAREAFGHVLEFLTHNDVTVSLEEEGDLAALSGVRKFPARVKCATLSWHALEAALQGETRTSTE